MIKLGIVMDSISQIKPEKDTSFAMLQEAQKRGYQLYYMEMRDLFLHAGEAYATTRFVTVYHDMARNDMAYNSKNGWFEFGTEQTIPLSDLDVILMRKDPPFDTEFIYATYILERAENSGTLVVNKPQSLRDCNEKLYTTWFAQFTPETMVTSQTRLIKDFHQKHQDIILKPLDGMGGASVFRIKQDDPNISVIIETLTHYNTQYCMAQRYLPAIKEGDKRVLVVDGKPIAYCLARIPSKGETRGNLAAGGRGEVKALSNSDWAIANAIGPELKRRGLLFVGLDIIGDKLTEINVTSPTCVQEIEAQIPELSITSALMDAIEIRIKKR